MSHGQKLSLTRLSSFILLVLVNDVSSNGGISVKIHIPDRAPPGVSTSTSPLKSTTTAGIQEETTDPEVSTRSQEETTTAMDRPPPSNETVASMLLHEILHKRADRKIRPNIYGKPVYVYCDFFISSIGPIDEVDMEFEMDIYFRMRWTDDRLSFNEQYSPLVIPHFAIEELWLPDIYFKNAKSGFVHTLSVPNKMANIFSNGTIKYSARMSVKLSCPMMLLHYPMDYQRCYVELGSYTYDTTDIILDWADSDPVEKPDEFSLPQFELLSTDTSSNTYTYRTGNFSALRVEFHLKRQIAFYMLQMYVPSALIVILSWVSFWISKDAIPARITLGVTTVLTMTTMLGSSIGASARVSYPKALDIWYAFCMILVFGVVIEFAVVNALARTENKRRKQQKMQRESVRLLNNSENHTSDDMEKAQFEVEPLHEPRRGRCASCVERGGCMTAYRVDLLARFFFPLVFVAFNVVYWSFYTNKITFGELKLPSTGFV